MYAIISFLDKYQTLLKMENTYQTKSDLLSDIKLSVEKLEQIKVIHAKKIKSIQHNTEVLK